MENMIEKVTGPFTGSIDPAHEYIRLHFTPDKEGRKRGFISIAANEEDARLRSLFALYRPQVTKPQRLE